MSWIITVSIRNVAGQPASQKKTTTPLQLSSSPWRSLHAVGYAEMFRMITSPSVAALPPHLLLQLTDKRKGHDSNKFKKKKSPGHPLTRCCKHVTHHKFFKLNYLLHATRSTQPAASPCFPEKWHIWQRDNSGLTSTALVCICPSAWLDIRFEFWWVRDDGRANSRLGKITITIFQPKSCCWYISLARCQLQWNPGWLIKEIKQTLYSSNWKNFPNTRKKISLDHTGLMKINITTL